MSAGQHTPGPWRWEFNAKNKQLHLVGGRPRFDLTIMDFERWGMNGATMRLRDPAHDGMQLLHRVHDRPDWIAPEPGREHHKNWHQLLTHPDAVLIESAPDMLAKLEAWQAVCDRITDQYGGVVAGVDFAALGRANRALIAREMQPADPVRDAAPVLLEAAHRALFLLAGPPWKPSDINLARRVLEDAIAKDTGQEGA